MGAMSIRASALFACAALLSAAAPAPADAGLDGEWRNTKNTVHLRMEPCGPALCGTVTWAAEQQRLDAKKGSGKELVGSLLLRDLKRGGDGSWRGKVFVPDLNSHASATVTVIDDHTILVSGCAFLGLGCRTQHWHRL
jgi:uncharacterized protein (DUF2147 family)